MESFAAGFLQDGHTNDSSNADRFAFASVFSTVWKVGKALKFV
jgi:hypothetical protein